MNKSNYIVYDCETGGLDERKNPITQYACIVLDGQNLKELDRFETYIQPYNDLTIDRKALESTMVSMSDVNEGITLENFVDVLIEFYELHQVQSRFKDAGRLVPVGHNIPFDNRFLDYAFCLQKKNYWAWVHENFIDTMTLGKMAWGVNGNEKLRLVDCIGRAKLTLTDAHGAMNDVESTVDLFRWYVKKLRSKGNLSLDGSDRPRGSEFFEFKCKAK